MKVAISIPDPLFRSAEQVSRRLRISRSQLYARAVEAYVKAHSGDDITAQLDRVYGKYASDVDPALEGASLEVLRREPR